MLSSKDPERTRSTSRGSTLIAEVFELVDPATTRVEVPFEGDHAAGVLLQRERADGSPAPTMIMWNGLDSTKEHMYTSGWPQEMAARGISVLMVDCPGCGEALRFQDLKARVETEDWAKACVDYLETRDDVDRDRIGLVGWSLGGYYAPRAAAFEKRLKLVVAWGANHNWGEVQKKRLEREGENPVPHYWEHVLWVWGVRRRRHVHQGRRGGQPQRRRREDHRPVPDHPRRERPADHVSYAHQSYDQAVNSPKRELRIFTLEEGATEHVGLDHMPHIDAFIADWVEDTLRRAGMTRLDGKVALITGTAGGQGAAAAALFAEAGATVVGCDIAPTDGSRRSTSPTRTPYAAGSTRPLRSTAASTSSTPTPARPASPRSRRPAPTEWDFVLRHELDVVFFPVKHAWPHLKRSGSAAVVLVGSTAGITGSMTNARVAHTVTKGGVVALTRQLAAEGAPYGIRVNCVSPGMIETPATRGDLLADDHPMRRIASVDPARPDRPARGGGALRAVPRLRRGVVRHRRQPRHRRRLVRRPPRTPTHRQDCTMNTDHRPDGHRPTRALRQAARQPLGEARPRHRGGRRDRAALGDRPGHRDAARRRRPRGRGPVVDDGDLERFAQVVKDHLERFGQRDELDVVWDV